MSNVSDQGLQFTILTCRPQDQDFRYHLACELRALGHSVTYIYLKRRPVATDMSAGVVETWSVGRLARHFVAMNRKASRHVVFNSTNLAFAGLCAGLRLLSPRAFWVFDLHDDLLYGSTGIDRRVAKARQAVSLALSDISVHAAPTLKELFPRSIHLGNGSSLPQTAKVCDDPHRVLVIARFDERFDFALMAEVATQNAEFSFDLFGQVVGRPEDVARQLDALRQLAPNVSYHGPYSDPDLNGLLSRYLLSFAPYKIDHPLTRYIDPLRYYHCLATHTGIVTTAIPQALVMADRLQIIGAAHEFGHAAERALAGRSGNGVSWREIAERLVRLVLRTGAS